ncbi:MAG: ATP synthase subunit I [Actinomyces sp.]|nr:MAG: ATP synthase subunit I [Actinomyces sp.]
MTTTAPNPLTSRLEGPSPAIEVARDLVRRGVYLAPVAIGLGAALGGTAGAASVAYGLAIVCVNFLLAAVSLGWAARVSLALMAAVALFGFLVRLGLITVAVLAVRDAGWVSLVPLGVTIIVSHLGLLFWEMRFVSASLAFPGLRPPRPHRPVDVTQ